MTIAPLQATDHAHWLPLWQGYLAFYRASVPDSVTALTFARLNDPAEPMAGALARDATGTAVGLVHFILHRSTWTAGDYCYLQDLFVAPEARGGGFGRALIEYVAHEATAAGCSRVYWLTHETNRDAMLLYDRVAERSGFVQYRKMLV